MTGVRIYHVSPWRRWGLWYVLGPIIVGLLGLGAASTWDEGAPMIVTAGIVFLIAVPFQVIVNRAKLELSPDNARLRQTGYELTADWSAIIDLRLTPGREGFVTREPMTGKGAFVLAQFRGVAILPSAPFYDAEQRDLLAQRRFIPIDAFAWHVRHGDMREEIIRLAPHLAPIRS